MSRRGPSFIALAADGEIRACAPESAYLLGMLGVDEVVGRSLQDFVTVDAWRHAKRILPVCAEAIAELWLPTLHGRVLRLRVLDRHKNLYEMVDDTARAMLADEERRTQTEDARASLAASVARELNDPMAIVQGRLELLLEMGSAADPDRIMRHLHVALDHARRVSGTLHLLRVVGRPVAEEGGTLSVKDLVGQAINEAGPHIQERQLEIDVQPSDQMLTGATDVLVQVLAHLVARLDEMCSRGALAWVRSRQRGDRIVLEVWSLPRGSRAAEPERAVPSESDPRLDVGVVGPVLKRLGGEVLGLRLSGGILFRLTLPLPSLPRTRPRTGDERALLVGTTARHGGVGPLLEREGFDVLHAPDAESALRVLEGERVDGVVAALGLSGMCGLSLCREVQRRHPDLTGRTVLLCDHAPEVLPAGVTLCAAPVDRVVLLQALGRRARRRRR